MTQEAPACRDCGAPISFTKRDDGKWNVNNADGSKHNCPKRQNNVRSFGRSASEQHDIRREAVLNAAVEFASAKISAGVEINAGDVIKVAKAFLQFVEEDRPA